MDTQAFEESIARADPAARCALVETLGQRAKQREAGTEYVPALLPLLEDPDDDVRQAATTALGWIAHQTDLADPTLLAPATRLLDDPVAMIRHDGAWILESLARRGVADGQAIPALIRNLGHENGDTRAASAFALCDLAKAGHADPAAVGPLRRQMEAATDPTEKRAVESALAALESTRR